MFICTFDEDMKEVLIKKNLKLIQQSNVGDKTIYTFEFNKNIYSLFSGDKKIFTSNKLFFNSQN